MTTNRKQFYAALLERVAWAFVLTLFGTGAVDKFASDVKMPLTAKLGAALFAAIAGTVKNFAGSAIGNGQTPSWLPETLDPATPPVGDPDVNAVVDSGTDVTVGGGTDVTVDGDTDVTIGDGD